MDLTADLNMLFIDLGVTAQVVNGSNTAGTMTVLWDSPAKVMSMFDGAVDTTDPSAVVKSSDVTALHIVHGSKLIINGATWYVTGITPDGTGLARLSCSTSPIQ